LNGLAQRTSLGWKKLVGFLAIKIGAEMIHCIHKNVELGQVLNIV